MEIKVSNCRECPFVYHGGCDANLDLEMPKDGMPIYSVLEDCPLNKESITVSLEG